MSLEVVEIVPILPDDVHTDPDGGDTPQAFVGGGQFNTGEGDAMAQPEPLFVLYPRTPRTKFTDKFTIVDLADWVDTNEDPTV